MDDHCFLLAYVQIYTYNKKKLAAGTYSVLLHGPINEQGGKNMLIK